MAWLRRAVAPRLSVLMVCMGNICRSPTAEGALRQRLHATALTEAVLVDSAGTHGGHVGHAPDPRAQRHALARGVDLSRLRARRVTEDDFRRFDFVLAMDDDNLGELQRLQPADAKAPAMLLMSFARRHPGVREVPDPYYGGPQGFERVFDMIDDACEGLVETLRERLAVRD